LQWGPAPVHLRQNGLQGNLLDQLILAFLGQQVHAVAWECFETVQDKNLAPIYIVTE
jgi:hypothetical protein